MRGVINNHTQEISKKMIGREINQKELRLLPYIQYTLMNSHHLDIAKINQEEREILSKWRKEGFMEGGASEMSITKEFWDFMNEVLFYSYVLEEDEK